MRAALTAQKTQPRVELVDSNLCVLMFDGEVNLLFTFGSQTWHLFV